MESSGRNQRNEEYNHGPKNKNEVYDVPRQRLQRMKRNKFRIAFNQEKYQRRNESRKNPQHVRQQRKRLLILCRNVKPRIRRVSAHSSLRLQRNRAEDYSLIAPPPQAHIPSRATNAPQAQSLTSGPRPPSRAVTPNSRLCCRLVDDSGSY